MQCVLVLDVFFYFVFNMQLIKPYGYKISIKLFTNTSYLSFYI